MPPSRKRVRGKADETVQEQPRKKVIKTGQRATSTPPEIKHAVINQYFAHVLSLRDYILGKLPATSRLRRKKIASLGSSSSTDAEIHDLEQILGSLLDTTLVGYKERPEQPSHTPDNRRQQWTNFTQKGDDSHVTLSDGLAGAAFSQSEIVDFVIWQLFSRCKNHSERPEHVLCDGFRRDPNPGRLQCPRMDQSIPGVFSLHTNPQVQALKLDPWPQLLKLLGNSGDVIMMDLLLDCAVFTSLNGGRRNYRQLSGIPLPKIPIVDTCIKTLEYIGKAPSEITFVRNRMMYARAALNARGLVQFGMRHIHVLNRSPYTQPDTQVNASSDGDETGPKNLVNTRRVMMYMFPRQFGLHNVFTSTVDRRETAQRLKDYTLREQEINTKFGEKDVRIPKRLRGDAKDLVQKLQILHLRCSYSKLLQHYCPVFSSQVSHSKGRKSTQNSSGRATQSLSKVVFTTKSDKAARYTSITELATSPAEVSAFCQAVIAKLLPNGFLGADDVWKHNQRLLLRKVDHFVRLRRFESMSLHEVMQDMKITEIEWLAPQHLMVHKTSQTDIRKRTELFSEFLYYVFDSILIPLLRSNFYITESNTDKYRLFYFRHDVWRYVAEPAMAALKVKMFEEVNLDEANRLLDSRQLGFSQVRLLPKGTSLRPIMNLRKKMLKRGNKTLLGSSINTLLKPAHTILQLEKLLNPAKLGSSMTSVGDVYMRLAAFKSSIGSQSGPLFFAKVDVQSAFDTIPQAAIVGLLDSIPQRRGYQIAKHIEMTNNSSSELLAPTAAGKSSKPRIKWLSTAMKHRGSQALLEYIESDPALKRNNTVFIEDVFKKDFDTSSILRLVASHIQQNLVKIGKKFFRQKEGIPQGSILSSTLCNYFYADLEIHVLKFLDSEDCLLLRLIDDFLLVTTDKAKATRFVEVMHAGVPEYGVVVNPAKTLVNFDLDFTGKATPVPRIGRGSTGFPYCGALIDTASLNVSKDRRPRRAPNNITEAAAAAAAFSSSSSSIFNSLTVEYNRAPGRTFGRKVLNAFKIQSHLMYLDTGRLNGVATVLSNLRAAFAETATKTWAYTRCLPPKARPSPSLVIRTLRRLADVAYLVATSRARRARYPGYTCDVRKIEVMWLTYSAFAQVLGRKQSSYGPVLEWLHNELNRLGAMKDIRRGRVAHVTEKVV
ncbi:hypothetical protein PFICI_01878 [Pestalotiopsis fici W106-1]|uniref:Telomerase reverse transcriptase n=1 Tax=Pestalotiopsis fici (strain W106-1 / CGMCC3.15140) TaxID=1229662 RepID=W3XQ06_PESFW|nr:uncharacterized protein PFICI_01878 [Pestalotiopsis fici W106-1]ETS88050.1 hypothetical protein PFICI_01878 [Pestalotiopsis fici W106-1]